MARFIRKHPYEVASVKDSILDLSFKDRVLDNPFQTPEEIDPHLDETF